MNGSGGVLRQSKEDVAMDKVWVEIVKGEKGRVVRRSEIQQFYFAKYGDGDGCEVVLKDGTEIKADCTFPEFRERLGLFPI